MFKSTIHGHFNATNTRANGRHRPLDSKHLNMALWPNHAKNTLCASSPVTTSHEPSNTANRDRLHALVDRRQRIRRAETAAAAPVAAAGLDAALQRAE